MGFNLLVWFWFWFWWNWISDLLQFKFYYEYVLGLLLVNKLHPSLYTIDPLQKKKKYITSDIFQNGQLKLVSMLSRNFFINSFNLLLFC